MSTKIEMFWGNVNDASADNTAALIAALALRAKGEPLELSFGAGDWYFNGMLPVNTHADPSIFDNVTLSGVYSAPAAQHQEETGGSTLSDRTRFIITLTDENHIWWNHIRTYRFGPLAFRDITFQLPQKGNLFAFGDPANAEPGKVTLRGLKFQRCYLTRLKAYADPDIGDGRAWLINEGVKGFVLNKTNTSFALRMQRCYDTELDLYIRGFRYGVINIKGDRVTGSVRGIYFGKLVEEYDIAGETPMVAAHWQRIYGEAPAFAVAVLAGQCAQLRAEWGYDEDFDPPTGPRDLPADITWVIADSAPTDGIYDHVLFTFPADRNCFDYFEPRMPYRFTPTNDSAEPPRWLFVTKIEATKLHFADHLSKSYVGRFISGNGSGVLRPFGTGVILDGDRSSVIDPSVGINAVSPNARSYSPGIFVLPGSKPVKVGGNAEGLGPNPINRSNLPVIIASSAGAQNTLQGGVDFLGSSDVPDHPLANPGGVGPAYDVNVREPIWNPHTRTQLFQPGRGLGEFNFASRSLTFHWLGDPEAYGGYTGSLFAVDDASPSATKFTTNLAWAFVDHLAGRSILFTSGVLTGRVAPVVNVEDAGGKVRVTVSYLPAAPHNLNPFRILGPPGACYRPGDAGTTGWELRRLRQSAVETNYRIRAYVAFGTPTLNVYGGAGSANPHALSAGWQTISGRLAATQMADDAGDRGPFMRLTESAALYVAWVEVDQNRNSGVYMPALNTVPGGNVTTPTPYERQYSRVGNTVTVSGRVGMVPLTANSTSLLRISLPIPSNLGATEDCAGTAFHIESAGSAGVGGAILANPTTDDALLRFFPTTTTTHSFQFIFAYQVI